MNTMGDFNTEEIYWEALNAWSHDWFSHFMELCKECNIILHAKEGWYYDIRIVMLLSHSPNITIDVIKKMNHISWHFPLVSINNNITTKIVSENPQIKWHYGYMSSNQNVTETFVRKNSDKKWNYIYLQKRLPESFFQEMEFDEYDKKYMYDNIRQMKKSHGVIIESKIEMCMIMNEKNLIELLCSPYLTWDTVFHISKIKPLGLKIDRDNLIDYIIKNDMKVERRIFIQKFFCSYFSASSLKKELLSKASFFE